MSEDDDLLNALPLELQLHIADAVGERCDRAALALASPRLLGLAACRELPSYQGLEMSLAFHHVLGGAIDEQLLRSYAGRSVANARKLRRRLKWLARLAAAAGLRAELRLSISGTSQVWRLVQPDSTVGALLVMRSGEPEGRQVSHYEGEEGAEHLVCYEAPGGAVTHHKGEKGSERLICLWEPSGTVIHFKGKKGAERVVWRREAPSGEVWHFEGEKRAERVVRNEALSGTVSHFEGEKFAERLVRIELPIASVSCAHLEGERGAERVVRIELPNGEVRHCEGERGAERLVRRELPYGLVHHYKGEKGAEQLVLLELPYGGVIQ